MARNSRSTRTNFQEPDQTPRAKKDKYPKPLKTDSFFMKTKIVPRTYGQSFYMDTLNESTITLCSGPAGCGKTWIVTAIALERLMKHDVERITITKPIVEAGDEELGFLPGDVSDKILPHFQSILDCFEDHIGPMMVEKLIEDGKIVFMPIAYMRGRNFRDSFIIIDEAQNMTRNAVKLMMTRIGEGSFMAINGDTDQIDLKNPNDSGLEWALNALSGKSEDIGVVEMSDSDIQRHPLISLILKHLK